MADGSVKIYTLSLLRDTFMYGMIHIMLCATNSDDQDTAAQIIVDELATSDAELDSAYARIDQIERCIVSRILGRTMGDVG